MSLAPLLTASGIIQLHVATATAALVLGAAIAILPKGTARHRAIGRLAAAAMLITALGSFLITGRGHLSLIHILSVITLISLAGGVWSIRRRNIRAHRGFMTGAWLGLLGAAAFTLLPGRIMNAVFLG